MKKLLVAAIGAAAAIGAFADPWYSGTSFESFDPDDNVLATAEGVNWKTNGAPTLTVKDIEAEWAALDLAGKAPDRAHYFKVTESLDARCKRALSVQTKLGEPSYRESDETKTAMGEVYVDVLVKPTVCDPETFPVLDNGAKIAIWLQEVESPVATNLMITAGYLTADGVVQTNYNCGTYGTDLTGAAEDWQRFTIKTFAAVDGDETPAFVVYRNKKALKCSAAKCDSGSGQLENLTPQAAVYHNIGSLFPSLVQTGDEKGTISKIGFDGTGVVDDILFTDEVPEFAEPFKEITLTWDSHVRNFTYTIQYSTTPVVGSKSVSGAGSMTLALADVPVDVAISGDGYENNWTNGQFTATGNIVANGKVFEIPQNVEASATANIVSKETVVYMTVNGKACYSVEEAIEEVNGTTGPATLSLNRAIALERAITFGDETLTGVTIDFAGNTITYNGSGAAITAAVPLTLTNSTVAVGGISATDVAVSASTNLTITAGAFTGTVAIGGNTAAITGGTFYDDDAISVTGAATGFITGGTFTAAAPGYLARGYGYSSTDPWVVGLATYNIVYIDGDTGDELEEQPTPSSYQIGDEIAPTTPEKSGYTFAGWTWKQEIEEEVVVITYVPGETIGNLELWASWTQDTPETPEVVPGGDPVVVDESKTNTITTAVIQPPTTGAETYTTAEVTAYQSLFKVTFTPNLGGEGFVVGAELDESLQAVQDIVEDLTGAVETIPLADVVAGDDDATVEIDAVPGLYYGVATGTSLENMAVSTWKQAKTGNTKLSLDVPAKGSSQAAGFYRIEASATGK